MCHAVAEKDFFMYFHFKSMVDNGMPGAWPVWTPRGTVGRVYNEEYYTLLYMKHESSGPCGFGEIFLCFSNCKSVGAIDPPGWGHF